MKRILCLFAAGVIFTAGILTALAQNNDKTVYGTYKDGALWIAGTVEDADFAVLNVYDDGKLCASANARFGESHYSFKLAEDDVSKKMRLVYETGEIYDVELKPYEEPTQAPAPTSTPEATKEPIPEVYEKEIDAVNAPAVITGVSKTVIDGESRTVFKMLYQGKEVETNVRDYIEIVSVPQRNTELLNMPITVLKEGDIIHFACDLQGRIKSVDLLLRPDSEDFIKDGILLSHAVGTDKSSQLALGVVTKSGGSVMYLANNTGAVTDIEVDKRAFVYKVERSSRGEVAELYGVGANAVPETYIANDNTYDDGGIISWEMTEDRVYALARIVRGIATDIFFFE